MRIYVNHDPEGIEEVPNTVAFDSLKIQIDNDSDCGECFLGDTHLVEIGVLNKKGLPVEKGIKFCLIDIDIDAVRLAELVEVVFSQFSDVDNNTGI